MDTSYSSELKKALFAVPTKKNCCRRAEFFGVLASKAELVDGGIFIHSENDIFTEYIIRSVRENFNRDAHGVNAPRGRGINVFFRNDNAAKYLSGIDSSCSSPLDICKCPNCTNAFLRGVFLASGRVTNPQKGFHLEFSLGSRADAFFGVFDSVGLSPKKTSRRNETLVYFKSSSILEDFFTIIGHSSVTIDIINNTIEGQFKSEANRRANFEMSNISRAVSAGIAQAELIQKLIDCDKLALLPQELKDTAILRLENPDASISQLAKISSPQVSKSGLNHRIQKILEFAKNNGIE